jgi:molybdopterin-guanine dinucleotide biosynthesis protein A
VSRALVAVLAGGLSRRMGAAKAVVAFGGEPLIARPLAAAAAAGLEAVVIAKPASELPPLEVPVWLEPPEPHHPLVGLVRALEGGRPVVAVACDMPFVTAELLAHLAALDRPAAPPGEPFPARYDPSALPALREALAREAPLRATLAALAPAPVDLRPFGDPQRLTLSINTPEQLAAASLQPR